MFSRLHGRDHDPATGNNVEFGTTEAWLKRDIITTCGVTSDELKRNDGDVFGWAIADPERERNVLEFDRRIRKE